MAEGRLFSILKKLFKSNKENINVSHDNKGDDTVNEIVNSEVKEETKQLLLLEGSTEEFLYDGCEKCIEAFRKNIQLDGRQFKIVGSNVDIRGINAGTYEADLSGNIKVIDELGRDVIGTFNISIVPGRLIIHKRKIVISSGSAKKVFDGSALKVSDVSITGDGLAKENIIKIETTGSQRLVGVSDNSFEYEFVPADVECNYHVEKSFGVLTVLDRPNKYEIEIKSRSEEFVYDGQEKIVEGFETNHFILDDHLYRVDGLSAYASLTEVGNVNNEISGTAIVYDAYDNDVTNQFKIHLIAGTLCVREDLVHKELEIQPEKQNKEGFVFNVNQEKSDNCTVETSRKGVDKIPDILYILSNKELKEDTLAHLYGLDEELFSDLSIDDMDFSTRISNRMHKPLNVETIKGLLVLSYEKLSEISGFGKTSFVEVDEKLRSLKLKSLEDSNEYEVTTTITVKENNVFKGHMLEVCDGDFSFLDGHTLDEQELATYNVLKQACECVDKDLLVQACSDLQHLSPILAMLLEESNIYNKNKAKKEQIRELCRKIPAERMQCKIEGFIYAYTENEGKRQRLFGIFSENSVVTFDDLNRARNNYSDEDAVLVNHFLQWCSFSIEEDISAFLENLYKNEREQFVLEMRSNGNTLEAVGNELGVTRERVRQIEIKVRRRFAVLLNKYKLILKIYAIRNQDEVLTPVELFEYFGKNNDVILYLLRGTVAASYTYDRGLDVFVVGNLDLSERIQQYIDSLPDTFSITKKSSVINEGIEEYDLVEEILEKAIDNTFSLTGKMYHRSRLTLTAIYESILKKYYPNGIWVYGKEEMQEFRNHILDDYGDIVLPKNDRALSTRICDVSVLCDRGTYKPKKEEYISKKLAQDIYEYIENSEQPIFMTNTIYSVFEAELLQDGVDNKYYLQGILHELFADKWIFRRDYISKDDRFTSVYSGVVNFIKKSTFPVKKQEIVEAFPGITEIVMNLATSDHDIINLFGEYIHSCRLKLSERDINYLHSIIEKFLSEKNVCHCKSIYEYVSIDYPSLLTNNFVMYSFSLYSLLEYLFNDEYNFSRPFIARENAKIERMNDILHEMVCDSDEIEVNEIITFAREHHFQIGSILDFVDSCNETHVLKNKTVMISVDKLGIDKKDAETIEREILSEIKDTLPIAQLQCISRFPAIGIQWNEWLIYSVIKKWSDMLEVSASANQFKQAVPLISKKGEMQREKYLNISIEEVGKIVEIDDLSNIDELIEKYSLEDLEGLDEL